MKTLRVILIKTSITIFGNLSSIKTGSKALIEIDGGVDGNNAAKLIATGADVLVAGNYVFSAANPTATIESLKAI